MKYSAKDSDPKRSPLVVEGYDNMADSPRMIDALSKLKQEVWRDGLDRSDWETKMEHFYNVRYAFLEEEITYPWPGASDIIIPIDDQLIDRIKPGMISLLVGQNPIVSFEELLGARAENRDKARMCEYTMDYLLKTRDPDFSGEFINCLDNVLGIGWGVLQDYYKYTTEVQRLCIHRDRLPAPLNGFVVLPKRANMEQAELLFKLSGGKVRPITKAVFDNMAEQIREMVKEAWHLFDENVTDHEAIDEIMRFLRSDEQVCEVIIRQETANTTSGVNIDPYDIWVPTYTRKLKNANRITVRMIETEPSLSRRQRDEGWNKKAVDQILKSGGTSPDAAQRSNWMINRNIDVIRNDREGISNLEYKGTYEVFATYCWGNFLGTKEKVKGVIVWSPQSNIPLKACALPYAHGEWPFTQIRFEMNDDRFYSSRGIPEKICDLSEELTWQERAVLNNAMLMNPTFLYEESSNFDPLDHPYTPGAWLKVGRVDRVTPLVAPDRQLNFERHGAILRSMIEQYAGAPDLALSRDQPSQTAPTATEVNLIDQLSNVSRGYHSSIVQLGMTQFYKHYWSNWIQWGPLEFNVKVAGEEPIKLTKQDIMGDFELIPKGTAGNVNPVIESQKALQRLTVLTQMKPILDQDPQARYNVDLVEALRDYLMKEDFVMSKRLLIKNTPEQQKQIIDQRQKQAQMAMAAETGSQAMPLQVFQKKLDKAERNAPMGVSQPVTM